ncbi:MAG TPA: ABC transporter ATP-binding protein [Acidimicrobiia bacterium]|nr:ABC transporter ATP-binding protein [Acidimicrobiia bacterium]
MIPAETGRDPLLRLEEVSKAYRTGSSPTVVLEDVNLAIGPGEKASLIGPSGSGKSTLLSLIAGLLRTDTGHVVIGGVATDALGDTARAALRAEKIGVVLQSDNLIPFLTAAENVELAMGFTGRNRSRSRVGELLAELDVAHRADHLPRQLSGGEAQRVAVAVALANEPDLLLADEIVGQLDSSTADRVADFVFGLEMAVLFVTHDRELAQRADLRLRLVDKSVVPQ